MASWTFSLLPDTSRTSAFGVVKEFFPALTNPKIVHTLKDRGEKAAPQPKNVRPKHANKAKACTVRGQEPRSIVRRWAAGVRELDQGLHAKRAGPQGERVN